MGDMMGYGGSARGAGETKATRRQSLVRHWSGRRRVGQGSRWRNAERGGGRRSSLRRSMRGHSAEAPKADG
jgi:hypothetical protein